MIVLPSIDLEASRVVKRVHGVVGTGAADLGAPERWARRWAEAGARGLHVVDLRAAEGGASDADAVRSVLAATRLPVQFGGGIRTLEQARERLAEGAERVVVASRAWDDAAFGRELVGTLGERVALAMDVSEGSLRLGGWTRKGPPLEEALERARSLGVRRLVLTDIDREGTGSGPDPALIARVRRGFGGALQVAGGLARREELRAIADEGVEAAIVGRALYDGTLPASVVAEDFA